MNPAQDTNNRKLADRFSNRTFIISIVVLHSGPGKLYKCLKAMGISGLQWFINEDNQQSKGMQEAFFRIFVAILMSRSLLLGNLSHRCSPAIFIPL